jgi:RNA polymerase-interacting CarD/CdnL/TRCF family regulator
LRSIYIKNLGVRRTSGIDRDQDDLGHTVLRRQQKGVAMENQGIYQVGDQIVHNNYGVGKVTGVVEKVLSGETTLYYRVAGDDVTYYVPVEKADCIRVRPLASGEKLSQALKLLSQDPVAMDDDYKKRRLHIKLVRSDGRLRPMVELLRDLAGRRQNSGLSDAEKEAYEAVERRLASELAAVMEKELEEARRDLGVLLSPIRHESLDDR